jgi:predicted negative regulator of RcsB-dependent stress response
MSTEDQLSQIKGVDSIKAFYDNNRKNVSIAAVVIILIAVGIYYYSNYYKPGKEKKAHAALFTAERYFRSDSVNKALYGDGQELGVIDVADQYGGTKAGNLAKYYAGRMLLTQGKYEEALSFLKDASFSDQFLAASSIILVGDCHSELGDYEKAAKTYMKAAKKRSNDVTTPRALYKAALAYEASSNYGAALKALKQIQSDYYQAIPDDEITKYIAKIEALEFGSK